jgi:hypothetical protein
MRHKQALETGTGIERNCPAARAPTKMKCLFHAPIGGELSYPSRTCMLTWCNTRMLVRMTVFRERLKLIKRTR